MFKLLFYSSLLYICAAVTAFLCILIIGMIVYGMQIPDTVLLMLVGSAIGICISTLEVW